MLWNIVQFYPNFPWGKLSNLHQFIIYLCIFLQTLWNHHQKMEIFVASGIWKTPKVQVAFFVGGAAQGGSRKMVQFRWYRYIYIQLELHTTDYMICDCNTFWSCTLHFRLLIIPALRMFNLNDDANRQLLQQTSVPFKGILYGIEDCLYYNELDALHQTYEICVHIHTYIYIYARYITC